MAVPAPTRIATTPMQFLTAKTVIYIRVAVLTWISFLLLKNPKAVTMANFTILLGEAMQLPVVQVTDTNPLFGVLAIFITSSAIADLIPAVAENIAYFETLVPTRLLFHFFLGAFCLISDYGLIANNLVFLYAFFEIWLNFLIYNNLRDEKYYRAKKYLEEHGDELIEQDNAQVVPIMQEE